MLLAILQNLIASVCHQALLKKYENFQNWRYKAMFEKIIQDVVNKLFIQLGFPELVNVPISNIDFQYILNKKLPMIKEFISQQMKE